MVDFDITLTKFTLVGFFLAVVFSFSFLQSFLRKTDINGGALWPWVLLFFGLFIFMRLPFIAFNRELDVDESQMLAQALSLKKYWIFWKYVDGLTQGPLTIYLLIVPTWLGLHFDYTSARLLGFIVLNLTLLLSYLTFENFFSRKISLIIFAPIVLFYILSQGVFSALCNEYLVLFLLSACFWLFSILFRQPSLSVRLIFLLALIAGMVPFAKLQGVPTALLTIVFAGYLILDRSTNKTRDFAALCLGGICFPTLVFGLTFYFDTFDYFWKFYVIGNLEYAGGPSFLTKVLDFPKFLKQSGQFVFLIVSYLVLIVYAIYILIFKSNKKTLSPALFLFSILHLLLAFYSVIKTGYLFTHYLQFLIIPLALFSGALLESTATQFSMRAQAVRTLTYSWLVICLLPHVIGKLGATWGVMLRSKPTISMKYLGERLRPSDVSQEINRFRKAGEDITVWGWQPAYHLETRAAQGTADVMVYRLLTPAPKQQDYINKYLLDLERSKPAVFVDEVNTNSVWFSDTLLYSHEKVPAIKDFVDKNYVHVSTLHGERIFVRKDRAVKLQAKIDI